MDVVGCGCTFNDVSAVSPVALCATVLAEEALCVLLPTISLVYPAACTGTATFDDFETPDTLGAG